MSDTIAPELCIAVTEDRSYGYFRLNARIVRRRYESGAWMPYGLDDDYGDGLLLSGLRITCQGDENSRTRDAQPVYGFSFEYHDVYTIDARKARRMYKTLDTLQRGLDKLETKRGYCKTFGEFCGRLADVLKASEIGTQNSARRREISGAAWTWRKTGDGINEINHLIYRWTQELTDAAKSA